MRPPYSYESDHRVVGAIILWCPFNKYPFGIDIRDESNSTMQAVLTKPYDFDEERGDAHLHTGGLLRRILDKSPFTRDEALHLYRSLLG